MEIGNRRKGAQVAHVEAIIMIHRRI